MFKPKKQTTDKATHKPTAKNRIVKDLPVDEDRDVKGGAVDAYLWFTPPNPPPPPSETRR